MLSTTATGSSGKSHYVNSKGKAACGVRLGSQVIIKHEARPACQRCLRCGPEFEFPWMSM